MNNFKKSIYKKTTETEPAVLRTVTINQSWFFQQGGKQGQISVTDVNGLILQMDTFGDAGSDVGSFQVLAGTGISIEAHTSGSTLPIVASIIISPSGLGTPTNNPGNSNFVEFLMPDNNDTVVTIYHENNNP